MAREGLGLDPDDLGSLWSAAPLSGLGAFAAGALVVVLLHRFSSGWAELVAAQFPAGPHYRAERATRL